MNHSVVLIGALDLERTTLFLAERSEKKPSSQKYQVRTDNAGMRRFGLQALFEKRTRYLLKVTAQPLGECFGKSLGIGGAEVLTTL